MARNTTDSCIICECLPCECLSKPKARKTVRPIRTVKPAVLQAPLTATSKRPPDLSRVRAIKSAEQLEMERAITVLAAADLLHYTELLKHREYIDLPAYRIDALVWRQRAGLG